MMKGNNHESSGLSSLSPRSLERSKKKMRPESGDSIEIQKTIADIVLRMVKFITNNEVKEIEEEIKSLPEFIEIFDLRNDDGLTLLHMACFKDQQKAFN